MTTGPKAGGCTSELWAPALTAEAAADGQGWAHSLEAQTQGRKAPVGEKLPTCPRAAFSSAPGQCRLEQRPGWGRAPGAELGEGADLLPQGSLKSERPFWGKGGGGQEGGQGGAQYGLLSGHIWEPWLWPKPSICCVRKVERRKREHDTLTAGKPNQQEPERHQPVTCGHRTCCQETKERGHRVEWPCRAGLMGTGRSPDPGDSCFVPKHYERNHVLANSRRFSSTPNQGPAISAQRHPLENPPRFCLTHLFLPPPRSAPGRSVQRWATTFQPGQKWGW